MTANVVSLRKLACSILLTISLMGLAACSLGGGNPLPTAGVEQPVERPLPVSGMTAEPTAYPAVLPPAEPLRTATKVEPEVPAPTSPPELQPTEASLEPIVFNLPEALLTSPTGLYPSPNRGELILQAEIPAGEKVSVMGRNGTGSHLRVVWGTGVGWVPTSFTDYNGRPESLDALPVFTREPPPCAIPLTTQFALSSHWTSDRQQRIAVVVDLFRSRFGAFPSSYLSLTVNGTKVESTRRQIVERGQFSLKDVVFTLPRAVDADDVVGYVLETTSDEPLTFMATIFGVPDGCQWDTK